MEKAPTPKTSGLFANPLKLVLTCPSLWLLRRAYLLLARPTCSGQALLALGKHYLQLAFKALTISSAMVSTGRSPSSSK